jgi:hypothetical protein
MSTPHPYIAGTMRLGVLVAILGELPDLRDQVCAPRKKPARRDATPHPERTISLSISSCRLYTEKTPTR